MKSSTNVAMKITILRHGTYEKLKSSNMATLARESRPLHINTIQFNYVYSVNLQLII